MVLFSGTLAAFTQLFVNEMNEFTQWSTVTLIIIPVVHICLLFLLLIHDPVCCALKQESLNFFKAARQNRGL